MQGKIRRRIWYGVELAVLAGRAARRTALRRRYWVPLAVLASATAVAVGVWRAAPRASHHGRTYRDAAGWTIEVPPGWHAVRFSDSRDGITSAGVQLSNIQLPPPALTPGAPMQLKDNVLTARGVELTIATDTDPALSHYGPLAVPPLRGPDASNGWRYWTGTSGSTYIEFMRFRYKGTIFMANAKIGPEATNADLNAVDAIIQSLR